MGVEEVNRASFCWVVGPKVEEIQLETAIEKSQWQIRQHLAGARKQERILWPFYRFGRFTALL
jgi:hypothetical protein